MNMTLSVFIHKVLRKWMKIRLQPIRVFCLHHVCKQFDADSMYPCDWMDIDVFKEKIIDLQKQGYQFISLTEAYKHLKQDYFRRKKYAVLTFDDGYKSILEVLPWLETMQIPVTLFVNGKYLDGKAYRENPNEQYLTYDELFAIISPLVEIGHHGWEHTSASKMSSEELKKSIQKNAEIISAHPRYVPFWAYTYGQCSIKSNTIIAHYHLIPVNVSGCVNFTYNNIVERVPIFYVDANIKTTLKCKNSGQCRNCIYGY